MIPDIFGIFLAEKTEKNFSDPDPKGGTPYFFSLFYNLFFISLKIKARLL